MYFTTLALEFTPLELNASIPDPPKPKDPNSKETEVAKPIQGMDNEESASEFNSNSSVSKKQSGRLSQIMEEKDDSDEDNENDTKTKDLYVHGLYIE
mmetsp:Transcript_24271/g.21541  ORF Transcript_24271/g.21541 Transcript_24271/m.21541 type:complete len:97 (+) Transcript_24271:331-621(+)|eukprot:CAMPEP_0205801462 /NCGR_PEP_ID=MMETSP0205-20121125/3456_1 /ASSEMBLY_ACC=CAM_ASM_000278 /TAXON_ID=36767 /ORGANISM="Euplotes focardii, Strain TN1" /LENGTH=96 /DNA_ID=CAMNT_0053066245 /DNA_START=325 /DNA_END=615 /DNA_ORIENTATION=+